MSKLLDTAEMLWNGDVSTADLNPLMSLLGFGELAPDVGFVCGFGNVTAFDTDDGLVAIDTGSPLTGVQVRQLLRTWRPDRPVHTAVFTHGHVDHACGVQHFDDPGLHVVAHEAIRARFERYRLTAGYNAVINARQFAVPGLSWPTEYRDPDQVYSDRLDLSVGGLDLELHHAKGETDDHTWVWVPSARAIVTGDLFIWASPNCGNPQKVQRYPREWAAALRKMATYDAEILCPGHGVPILGADRVRRALTETAELLGTLHDAALALMNEGASLDDLLQNVRAPAHLLERPYLRPVYDEPDFIVRNVWRLYGGWYDGNPAHLKPPAEAALALEVCALAGGPDVVADRALAALETGDLALAAQLVEWAWRAAPDVAAAAMKRVYAARAKAESSLMAKAIYRDASGR